MADPTLMMAPIGPGIAFIVPVADSSVESSPQASSACLSPAGLEAAATPTTLHAPDAISPTDMASKKLEDVVPEDQEAAPVPARAPLRLRHATPRKQRAGTFVQPWQFSFEPLTAMKSRASRSAEPPAQSAPRKKPARKVHANASPEPSATPCPEAGAAPAPARPAVGYRRQHGTIHTPRVDFLLKKYLGDRSQELLDPATPAAEPPPIPALPPTAKAVPLPVPGLKRIVQVKTEQDAAIAAIKAKPRQFRARPVPLEVAETTVTRRRSSGTTAVSTASVVLQESSPINVAPAQRRNSIEKAAVQEENGGEMLWRARPVPPSSAEPRYAEMVADSVLRCFSHGELVGEGGKGKGLQKWLSWPGEQGEAAGLATAAAAAPPARPQSARPRGSSFGGYQALNLPETVDEGDE